MNRIQHVKKFCTAEKEAVMLTEMGNNGYELCAKEGNAYYFKRAIEVKNLAQPDVSGQLPAVLKKLYELSNEYREIKSYNSRMENESNTEVLQREFHQRWTLCLRFHNDIDTMIKNIEAGNLR